MRYMLWPHVCLSVCLSVTSRCLPQNIINDSLAIPHTCQCFSFIRLSIISKWLGVAWKMLKKPPLCAKHSSCEWPVPVLPDCIFLSVCFLLSSVAAKMSQWRILARAACYWVLRATQITQLNWLAINHNELVFVRRNISCFNTMDLH